MQGDKFRHRTDSQWRTNGFARRRISAIVFLTLLFCAPAWADSSVLAARCNNTEDSVGGTTYTTLDIANVVLHASELVNTHRYLIGYNAALGGTNASGEVAVRVMYGATEIAEANYETDAEAGPTLRNGPRSGQGGSLTGFYILTANGSDSMWLEKKWSAANAAYISGKCLMSIDLTNLTNDTHYFDSCLNGSGVVMIDSSDATTDTTLLVDTYTTAAEDYLVLASAEIWDSSGSVSSSFSYQGYLYIDGAVQGPAGGGKFTMEDLSDFWNWSYAKVHTFTAAAHTFQIRIGNVDTPPASHQVYGRRPRIILIRKSAYVDIQTKTHDGFNVITNDYNTWQTDTSLTYTNNTGTTENVVLIANGSLQFPGANEHAVVRLYNNTDATANSEVGTACPREVGDTIAVTSIGFLSQLADGGSKQILYRATADSSLNNPAAGFVRLIAWNLKENLGAPPPSTSGRRSHEAQETYLDLLTPIQLVKKELGIPPCNCEE